ncbi:hypothetical protein V6N12_011751 [Hibiscus sabdariffa]|uniref:Uncharacterized protein n=1 Tax=Hibiscus sabdariffa TaxID=183260 RepID=A0ABR2BV53_9ROSI
MKEQSESTIQVFDEMFVPNYEVKEVGSSATKVFDESSLKKDNEFVRPTILISEKDVDVGNKSKSEEMIVQEVDKKLLEEPEVMSFPTSRAICAPHFSGTVLLAFNFHSKQNDNIDVEIAETGERSYAIDNSLLIDKSYSSDSHYALTQALVNYTIIPLVSPPVPDRIFKVQPTKDYDFRGPGIHVEHLQLLQVNLSKMHLRCFEVLKKNIPTYHDTGWKMDNYELRNASNGRESKPSNYLDGHFVQLLLIKIGVPTEVLRPILQYEIELTFAILSVNYVGIDESLLSQKIVIFYYENERQLWTLNVLIHGLEIDIAKTLMFVCMKLVTLHDERVMELWTFSRHCLFFKGNGKPPKVKIARSNDVREKVTTMKQEVRPTKAPNLAKVDKFRKELLVDILLAFCWRNVITVREANNGGNKDGARVKEHVEVKFKDPNLVEIKSDNKKEVAIGVYGALLRRANAMLQQTIGTLQLHNSSRIHCQVMNNSVNLFLKDFKEGLIVLEGRNSMLFKPQFLKTLFLILGHYAKLSEDIYLKLPL